MKESKQWKNFGKKEGNEIKEILEVNSMKIKVKRSKSYLEL